jgi:AraC-like DNA-binding protein
MNDRVGSVMSDDRPIPDSVFRYYERLVRVQRFVEHNYHDEISVEVIARVAGLDSNYFSTYFRKKTGVTFSRWLNWFRIDKAKEQLRSRDHSIVAVASSVGYGSVRAFQRAFREVVGCTPVDFRRQVQDSLATPSSSESSRNPHTT